MYIIVLEIPHCGASTLCNSLTSSNLFEVSDDIMPGTAAFQYETITHNSKSLTVVDCPGYFTGRQTIEQYVDNLNQEFSDLNTEEKFFVFVRPTGRIKEEEITVIRRLLRNVVMDSRYCVVINKTFKDNMIDYKKNNSYRLYEIYGQNYFTYKTFLINSRNNYSSLAESLRDIEFFNQQRKMLLDHVVE